MQKLDIQQPIKCLSCDTWRRTGAVLNEAQGDQKRLLAIGKTDSGFFFLLFPATNTAVKGKKGEFQQLCAVRCLISGSENIVAVGEKADFLFELLLFFPSL